MIDAKEHPPDRILVPVDFSACSHAALEYAVALAVKLGAAVDVLHVWQHPPVDPMQQSMPPISAFARSEAGQAMERLLADVDGQGVPVQGRLASGDPVSAILDVATKGAYDLIVMGRQGRGFLSHLLVGSVAERITKRASCPVLTLHPRAAALAARPHSEPPIAKASPTTRADQEPRT